MWVVPSNLLILPDSFRRSAASARGLADKGSAPGGLLLRFVADREATRDPVDLISLLYRPNLGDLGWCRGFWIDIRR